MITVNPKDKTTIAVIGNGFDLKLGLKTSYSDFIKSEQFLKLIKDESDLANYLSKILDGKNWVDIEHELANYATNAKIPELKQFKKEFTNLKSALSQYLKRQTTNENADMHFNTVGIFSVNCFDAIYSLNYTDAAFSINSNQSNQIHKNLNFVHGTTYHKNIVFGVADGAVNEKYNFLLKSDHSHYGGINLSKAIHDADEIHFYGLSFGDTDDNHFVPAFSNLKDKKLVFYVYGLSGYEGVRNRLVSLTKNGLSGLKTNNEVIFYDVNTYSGFNLIDQEWLNNKYTETK